MPTSRLDGVLVVDKPAGKTSHDIVAEARRRFGTQGVGHAGTLDPMATGVLVLLFGEARKLSAFLTAEDKSYRATIAFGSSTDTFDADGRVVKSVELTPEWLSRSLLGRALAVERDRVLQVPPSVSAIQVGGQRAYDRARRGEAFELESRPIAVKKLELFDWSNRHAQVELTVSKGYYVRAFARDLGESLGVPSHLTALRRLASGAFGIEAASIWPPPAELDLLGVAEAAARALPVTRLSPDGVRRARSGQPLSPADALAGAFERVCAWFGPNGEIVALGTSNPSGSHRVTRGFVPFTK